MRGVTLGPFAAFWSQTRCRAPPIEKSVCAPDSWQALMRNRELLHLSLTGTGRGVYQPPPSVFFFNSEKLQGAPPPFLHA